MRIYHAHHYDANFRLKLSFLLWLLMLFGLRHGVLQLADALHVSLAALGDWARLQLPRALLVSDLLIALVLYSAGLRVADAKPWMRRLWHQGRRLLLVAYGLDLLLFVGLQGKVLLAQEQDAWGPAWLIVGLDLLVLAYLLRSTLVRDIFADFPEPGDDQRARMTATPPADAGAAVPDKASLDYAVTLHQRGMTAFLAGDAAEAVVFLRRALAIDPQNALYARDVGELCRRLGRHSEAVFFGREAVRLSPGDADAYGNLGLALVDAGRLDEGLAAYRQALALNAGHVAVWNNLGVLLRRQGDQAGARAAFSQALALQPDHAEARANLAAGTPETAAHAGQNG